MPLICALDQGTTSTRAIMYEAATLRRVALHQLEHTQYMPQAGCVSLSALHGLAPPDGPHRWVEHDPVEVLARANECIAQALQQATAACGEVSVLGLGITNQRETTVVWCKTTGRPLMNAIVWQDTRTRRVAAAVHARACEF